MSCLYATRDIVGISSGDAFVKSWQAPALVTDQVDSLFVCSDGSFSSSTCNIEARNAQKGITTKASRLETNLKGV